MVSPSGVKQGFAKRVTVEEEARAATIAIVNASLNHKIKKATGSNTNIAVVIIKGGKFG